MNKRCIVYRTVNLVSRRWSLLIILELYKGKKRYSELMSRLPDITPKVLSCRLKELIKDGLIHRKITVTPQIKSTYFLSQSGKDFIGVVREIKAWGLKWKTKNTFCLGTDCKDCIF